MGNHFKFPYIAYVILVIQLCLVEGYTEVSVNVKPVCKNSTDITSLFVATYVGQNIVIEIMKGSDIMEKINNISDDELDSVSGGTRVPYVVKEGDSLEELARKFHCTVEQIMRWNNIADRDQMLIGRKLIIKF